MAFKYADRVTRDVANVLMDIAARVGSTELARVAIDAQANLERPSPWDGLTPLHSAAAGGHNAIIDLLVRNDVDPNLMCGGSLDARSAIAIGVCNAQPGTIRTLAVLGADVNKNDYSGDTPIGLAVSLGDCESARVLLECGANANSRCGQQHVLHRASEDGSEEIVKMLLDYGADPLVVDNLRRSPLDCAISNGRLAVTQLLKARIAANEARSR